MVSRATLPRARRAHGAGLLPLIPSYASVLFVVAHPGIENVITVLRDGSMNSQVLCLTDGSPREIRLAIEAGFSSREEFAKARREEIHAALETAGFAGEHIWRLHHQPGDLSRSLARLAIEVMEILRERKPDVVVAHPYRGDDPDEDAAAFAAQGACALLELENHAAPARVEWTETAGDFRAAPLYDFSKAPARRQTSNARWRKLAADALRALGLAG